MTRAIEHFNGRALQSRGGHLAGHSAFQDQTVKLGMIAAAHRVAGKAGGPDRLMGLLRIFGFGFVDARTVGHIAGIIAIGYRLARGGNGAAVHLHAIGTHVSNTAIFIKLLRDTHRVACRIAEFTGRFLLQGRGRKWRWRVAGKRLGFDRFNREQAVFNRCFGGCRFGFVGQVHLAKLFALMNSEPCFKSLTALLHL